MSGQAYGALVVPVAPPAPLLLMPVVLLPASVVAPVESVEPMVAAPIVLDVIAPVVDVVAVPVVDVVVVPVVDVVAVPVVAVAAVEVVMPVVEAVVVPVVDADAVPVVELVVVSVVFDGLSHTQLPQLPSGWHVLCPTHSSVVHSRMSSGAHGPVAQSSSVAQPTSRVAAKDASASIRIERRVMGGTMPKAPDPDLR